MKRSPKTTVMKVRALTDPRPAFVSIVKGGANQRPFRAVKMAAAGAEAGDNGKDPNMKIKTKKGAPVPGTPEGFEIASLTFKGGQFTDEAAVSAWMTEGGFEDFTITAKDGGFEVLNTADTFAEDSLKEVEGLVEGLTVVVGQKVAEEDTAKAEEVAAAEAAEAAKKNPSTVETIAVQPLAPAAKEDAPAAEDATKTDAPAEAATEVVTVDPTLPGTDITVKEALVGLQSRAKDMDDVGMLAWIVDMLAWMLEDHDDDDIGADTSVNDGDADDIPSVAANLKTAANALIAAMTTMSAQALQTMTNTFKARADAMGVSVSKASAEAPAEVQPVADAAPAETAADAEPTAKGDEPEAGAAVTKEPAAPEANGDIWTAIRALTTGMEAIAAKLDAKEPSAEAEAAAKAARVEEPVSQTRKGTDVATDNEAEDTKKAQEAREFAARRMRSALGISPGRNGFAR